MLALIIDYLDKITIVFAFITMIFTFINYIQAKRQLEKIKIVFVCNEKEILIDSNLTRKDCQRGEIQGILRIKLKKDISFYDIDFLKKSEYFENIYRVQNAKSDKLSIYVTPEELKQFEIREN